MKKSITTLFGVLSLMLCIQTAIAQSGRQQGDGYSYGDQWYSSGFTDRLGSSPTAYNIRNGKMPSVFPVVDTSQEACYGNGVEITCPSEKEAFCGQDAQYSRNMPSYTDNGDGTVTDNVTGLMWQQSPDQDSDGDIDAEDKVSYVVALFRAEELELGGYDDWRLPTIKELYSLMDFRGIDPSGYEEGDGAFLVPFIDTRYFDFNYGDTAAGERIIDSQYASSTLYVANIEGDSQNNLLFGVNFADGRIKGYGLTLFGRDKKFFVMYVRGNAIYGQNQFKENENGTVTDKSTQLMWAKDDSTIGLNWENALSWVEQMNALHYLGYNDWRLPNVKELQGIVDYTRSPDTTDSAAIDSIFNATSITNEAGQPDYPYYWSSTTHANWTDNPGSHGAYVAFGRAMGLMNRLDKSTGEMAIGWVDVHGAGAQRSDPKAGNPDDFPEGFGPQGDAIRIYNYVRLVRDIIRR